MPLLKDADLFGWIATSRAAVVSNGFMQMMEVLALGCPAICVDRGIGMWSWSLAKELSPYLSLGEKPEQQQERLAGWLRKSPLSDEQQAALKLERHGARVCADLFEAAAQRRALPSRLERWASRVKLRFRSQQATQ